MPLSFIRSIFGNSKKQQATSYQKSLNSRNKQGEEKRAPKSLDICSKCSAVFYNKQWYDKSALKKHLANAPEIKNIGFAAWFEAQPKREMLCPACKQNQNSSEGVVYLQNIPAKEKAETLRHIENIEKRAKKRDAMDRIVKIIETADSITIHTSENQLALSIGKQIARSRKGGTLDIQFSKEDEAVRVYWTHPL